MIYAEYNTQGNITGYCNVQKDNMVLIPTDIYSDTMHNDYVVVNGEFVLKTDAPNDINNDVVTYEPVQQDLAKVKRSAVNELNGMSVKTYMLTPGMEYIYNSKEQEALAYLTDADPILDDYPFIKLESEVRGITALETASLFKAKAKVAREQLAIIESNRQRRLIAINSATTVEEAKSA